MTLIVAIVTGVINFMIGGLWYGMLFQKAWIKAMGINPEDIGKNGDGKKEMMMTLIVEVIISILTILFLSAIHAATPLNALVIGIITVLSGLKNYFFEQKSLTLILINESYKMVAFMVIGLALLLV
ncbi:DUF1761 domain-containing protein [Streptococcus uberis]|uniref:DUF1761 domain-containing protein n=1 Tax=Streptococcus uberis TaxID=1349 RepID=UPI000541F2E4|nr:DUF1761 domain-containing protein [Streptococcus uberis]KHD40817.1 membrane protein [Streptococcus hongkongensis]KKF55947.1 membrane protein [Streptococcus uberis 6780]MCK1166426.1 DUF1761 domain-containing protein [Streptococcus uberis]MCK1189113.1 DUF1761 domain-containing protein [Streptococcus uberis]MCK1199402.1 DUF1761 domain-containing protein [Streptococcus uberis]